MPKSGSPETVDTEISPRRTALIVEPQSVGHYLVYVRLLIDALRAEGVQTVVALRAGVEASEEFRAHLAEVRMEFCLEEISFPLSVRRIRRLALRHGADHTIIPNADRLFFRLAWTGWSGPGCITGLVMQDPALDISRGARQRVRMCVKRLVLLWCSKRRSLRMVWLRGPGSPDEPKRVVARDPVVLGDIEADTPMRQLLSGLDPHRYWFSLVGSLTPRKNPFIAIRALAKLEPRGCGLLIAGPIYAPLRPEVERAVAELRERGFVLVVEDRTLTNLEMSQAVAFADAVVLPYSTHAPPSTLGKAAALGTRVIAAGSSSFIRHAVALDIGALTGPLDEDAVFASMSRAVALPRPRPRTELVADSFARIVAFRDYA